MAPIGKRAGFVALGGVMIVLCVGAPAQALYWAGETLGRGEGRWIPTGFFMTPNPQGYMISSRFLLGFTNWLDFEVGLGRSHSVWDVPVERQAIYGARDARDLNVMLVGGRLRLATLGPLRLGLRGGGQANSPKMFLFSDDPSSTGWLQLTLGVRLSEKAYLYAGTGEAQGGLIYQSLGIWDDKGRLAPLVPFGFRWRVKDTVVLYLETVLKAGSRAPEPEPSPNIALAVELRRR